MQSIGDILKGMAAPKPLPDDYKDAEGFLMCGKCHTRKQADVDVPEGFVTGGTWRVAIMCKCRRLLAEAKSREIKQMEFDKRVQSLRRNGITDRTYLSHRFEHDDVRNKKVSQVCRDYVLHWEEMKKSNIGILFYGGVGTGKSFMACCIANALHEKLVSSGVTNFPRLLHKLQNAFADERQSIIDKLNRYDLLVIDDLGVERSSAYSLEQMFNVVDTRYRSGKPLIVTTNLALEDDMKNCQELEHKRIYDRVLEMCPIRLRIDGVSRRVENAERQRENALKMLGVK
jgi:DNA replication protein DnaC